MHLHFADDPDMENLIIDSAVIRAHPCATGASKKTEARMSKRWDVVEGDFRLKSTSVLMD